MIPLRGSVYDAFRDPPDKRLRRLPSLVAGATRLVWSAAPRELAVSVVLQVISGVGVGIQLLVGSRVLSTVLTADSLDRGAGDVVPGLLLLLGVTAVVGFAGRAQTELRVVIAELTGRHAQARVIDIATMVDLEAYERPEFHDRLQRATTAALFRPHSMTNDVITLLSLGIGVLGITVALAALQPMLLPVVVLAYVPLSMASSRNSRTRYRFGHRMTPNDRQRSYLAGVLTAKPFAQELRSFDVAGFIRRRYDDLWDLRVAELRRSTNERLRRSLAASVATSALSAASIGLLVWLLLTDRMGVAAAATAAVGIQQLGGRLSGIVSSGSGLYEHSLFIEDFTSFLDLAPAVAAARPTGAAPDGFATLTVEDVTFAYPGTDRPALTGISLSIRAGEVVALVGENGSGKTTLAKLLCHLYAPTSGRIWWDGTDTAECDPGQLRRRIAVIFQDFVQYALPADENIAVGDQARADDLAAVTAAAVESGADGFLADLPQGYRTMLGRQFDGGHELSIGQWQRIALARAFFRGAPFLILDEPTAALDPRAEHELFERIRAVAAGRTVLLISHRFSSVRSADRIFVLRQGKLVEQGNHDQLMAGAGLYAELFRLQAAAYDGATPA